MLEEFVFADVWYEICFKSSMSFYVHPRNWEGTTRFTSSDESNSNLNMEKSEYYCILVY